MDTVNLAATRDDAFIREVEKESGQRLSACYQCGNCTAGCPSAFVYDLQVNQIMRAAQTGQKDIVFGARSLWLCVSCSTCTARCPNDIDVAVVMDVLRHMAAREGRVRDRSVNAFWQSFLDTVRLFGRTYELGVMAAFMARTGRVLTDLDLAPKALTKGKLPFAPHIAGKEHVAKIFQRFDDYRRQGGQA
jgi:heterodisulfide reductase subunit C